VQNSSSFKYIASSNNIDLASVSSCKDCTSICLPRRWVAETVWVDKNDILSLQKFLFQSMMTCMWVW
jgi:hypothetical protein